MALPPSSPEITSRMVYSTVPSKDRVNEEYPPIRNWLKPNIIQPVQVIGSSSGATELTSGTKAVTAAATRLRDSPLSVKTLTVKLRALGATATYVAIGGQGGQDFRLTAAGESVDLDIDPYEVWVISDNATAPVLEWIATR